MTAFDVPIGRIDGAAPGLAGKLPQPGASVEEVKVFLNQLNNKDPAATLGNAGNPFKPQAPYGGKYGFLAWTSAALNPEVTGRSAWPGEVPGQCSSLVCRRGS